MKKTVRHLIICSVVAVSVSSCSTWNKLDNQERGAVIGGGAGAVVGNAVSPGIGGTVVGGGLGAVAGGVIGRQEDRRDRR